MQIKYVNYLKFKSSIFFTITDTIIMKSWMEVLFMSKKENQKNNKSNKNNQQNNNERQNNNNNCR